MEEADAQMSEIVNRSHFRWIGNHLTLKSRCVKIYKTKREEYKYMRKEKSHVGLGIVFLLIIGLIFSPVLFTLVVCGTIIGFVLGGK